MLTINQLEQLLRRRFGEVKKAKGGLELRINCPYCGDDKKFKCWININKGCFHCWRNESHSGKIYKLLNIKPEDIPKASFMEEREKMQLEQSSTSPGVLIPLTSLPNDHPAIQYLTTVRARPFDPQYLEKNFGVKYCSQGRKLGKPEEGFWFDTTNTLIFPVYMQGILVGWQARLLYNPDNLTDTDMKIMGFPYINGEYIKPPKYYTTPFPKGQVLYNFDNAVKYNMVVVSEGVFDVFSLGNRGVGTFGTGISEQQLNLLKTYWDTVILLLDPDVKNDKKKYIINNLKRSVEVIDVVLKDKDPGDMDSNELWAIITQHIMDYRKKIDYATS